MTDVLSSELTNNLGGIVSAVAALGTAAYGLVDASKFLGGGISIAGMRYIRQALEPFAPLLRIASGRPDSFNETWTRAGRKKADIGWYDIVRANWINGMPKDEQKAVAKALVRIGLASADSRPASRPDSGPDPDRAVIRPDEMDALANFFNVSSKTLGDITAKLANGTSLEQPEINILGRIDSMLDARLDGAFERADQFYRSSARMLATPIAIGLAFAGEWLIVRAQPDAVFSFGDAVLALLVGLLAVPLAPVAKDLSSALQIAVKAMKSAKS